MGKLIKARFHQIHQKILLGTLITLWLHFTSTIVINIDITLSKVLVIYLVVIPLGGILLCLLSIELYERLVRALDFHQPLGQVDQWDYLQFHFIVCLAVSGAFNVVADSLPFGTLVGGLMRKVLKFS